MAVILRAALERHKRGLTQAELGRRLGGIPQKTISEVERGLQDEETLARMEIFFGMKRSLLQRPVPDRVNPLAAAEIAERLSAHLPDDPPRATQVHEPEVPPPPSLRDAIRKQRGE